MSNPVDLGIQGLAEIEMIGSGGSSIVYKAVWEKADISAQAKALIDSSDSSVGTITNEAELVAVKVLRLSWDPAARRRFEREQRVMNRLLEAAGFVPILETGETSDGSPYIIMPFYRGGSLQDRISRNGAMDWPRAVRLVEQVAETLAEAHARDVFHRDIKPANILLSRTGQAHIADFGISLIGDEAAARSTSTAAFTPAYSPPESFARGLKAVATTDVYGLAATLWALLAGHTPFKERGEKATAVTVFGRVAMQQVGDLRETVPSPICRFIERAMAKVAEERPQSMGAFLAGLQAAREDAYRGVDAPRMDITPLDLNEMDNDAPANVVLGALDTDHDELETMAPLDPRFDGSGLWGPAGDNPAFVNAEVEVDTPDASELDGPDFGGSAFDDSELGDNVEFLPEESDRSSEFASGVLDDVEADMADNRSWDQFDSDAKAESLAGNDRALDAFGDPEPVALEHFSDLEHVDDVINPAAESEDFAVDPGGSDLSDEQFEPSFDHLQDESAYIDPPDVDDAQLDNETGRETEDYEQIGLKSVDGIVLLGTLRSDFQSTTAFENGLGVFDDSYASARKNTAAETGGRDNEIELILDNDGLIADDGLLLDRHQDLAKSPVLAPKQSSGGVVWIRKVATAAVLTTAALVASWLLFFGDGTGTTQDDDLNPAATSDSDS